MRILGAALLPLILLVPSATEAQRRRPEQPLKGPTGKAQSACGQRILPLVQGNKWTYGFVQSAVEPRADLLKLTPSQPGTISIEVKAIETKGTDTVITLEEKSVADLSKDPKKHIYDERTITSTITCNPKKFEISPESFLFAGEPGGHFGLVFDKLERSRDTTWKLVNGVIGDAEWREDIVGHFTRSPFEGSGAKHGGGKLELERKFTPAEPTRVNTKLGVYDTERLAVTTTGRVTLDQPSTPETKVLELPAAWTNQLWIAPNVGVVQVLNAYAHMYQLIEVQLK